MNATALSNGYGVAQLPAPLRFDDVESAQAHLTSNGVGYVLAQFVDIHGVAKAKSVPVAHLELGTHRRRRLRRLRDLGSRHGTARPRLHGASATCRRSARAVDAGLRAHRLRRPRRRQAVAVLPAASLLRKQLERLSANGWTMYTGIEPEFMLLQARRRRRLAPCDATRHARQAVLRLQGPGACAAFPRELSNALRAAGIDVYQIDHEDANGQFEINFTYADCLTSADHYMFFKMAASEIAQRARADLHLHAQAVREPHGHAARTSTSRSATRTARTCSTTRTTSAAWICRSWPTSFSAGCSRMRRRSRRVCAPTVNSYKRLVVGRSLSGATWAPALHRVRRQQPHRDGAHSRGRHRTAAAGRLVQPVSGDRRDHRGRARRHRRKLDPGEPRNVESLRARRPSEMRDAGHRHAAAEPERSDGRAEADERRARCARRRLSAGVHQV